jgi:hypothetical protein
MNAIVKPFSPADARGHKIANIPPVIIECVNELLALEISGQGYASITQDELVERILSKGATVEIRGVTHTITDDMIYQNNWLDFEPLYRQEGWTVTYDKPGYNETHGASWLFKESK